MSGSQIRFGDLQGSFRQLAARLELGVGHLSPANDHPAPFAGLAPDDVVGVGWPEDPFLILRGPQLDPNGSRVILSGLFEREWKRGPTQELSLIHISEPTRLQ